MENIIEKVRPLQTLMREVREAIERYDASGDHNRYCGGMSGDCIRCHVVNALPRLVRGKINDRAHRAARR